jgi:hypothetical protein
VVLRPEKAFALVLILILIFALILLIFYIDFAKDPYRIHAGNSFFEKLLLRPACYLKMPVQFAKMQLATVATR